MSLFLRLSGISLGRYCQKNPAKSGGWVRKKFSLALWKLPGKCHHSRFWPSEGIVTRSWFYRGFDYIGTIDFLCQISSFYHNLHYDGNFLEISPLII